MTIHKAEIKLKNNQDYIRLLHAFMAIDNMFSHDENMIRFEDKKGFQMLIDMTVNRVSYGHKETPVKEHDLVANVSFGDLHQFILCLMAKDGQKEIEE